MPRRSHSAPPVSSLPVSSLPVAVRAVASVIGADDRYCNRELSWLDFNARVLALSADATQPLLERVKFCAIFSGNLDEFYEVRVAGIKDQLAAGVDARSLDGKLPADQLPPLAEAVARLVRTQGEVFSGHLVPALAAAGIEIIDWEALTDDDRRSMRDVYDEGIYPVLTPLAVDPGHPFPYISNLSLNLAAMVRNPSTGDRRFARVKVPPLLPRFVACADGRRLLPLETLIAVHLDGLFPGMQIEGAWPFRVTRNADLSVDEEDAEDLVAAVEMELRRRRFGRAVRLETAADMPDAMVAMLMDELELDPTDVYRIDGLLDFTGLWGIVGLDRPDLKDQAWKSRTQSRLADTAEGEADLFSVIRDGDVLVHHPYDSFTTSVQRFIRQAAEDPDVLTIKMTLYRTSGDSPIVKALIDAAERGKQVAALVEVKARFDEQANIAWARALEQAGVHVVYGVVGLKTHTKVALVIRAEHDGLRRYCHVATGNYNPSTARLYEDLGLFSCDPVLGDDLVKLFNSLTGYSQPASFRRLLVAPTSMRDRIVSLIDAEHAPGVSGGRITMKMNSLVDAPVIDALYRASQDGVEIDLVVRGICCLRPGVPGLSERIRVRSIVGRFLEHSRVFRFEHGDDGRPLHLIGSADMMPRNLDGRVEAIVPVSDPALQHRLDHILDTLLADTARAWLLGSDGAWGRLDPEGRRDAQAELMAGAVQRVAG